MSCGCGKLPKGDFSSQRDSWSCKSDLRMANWDPYPELENPKNCYGNNVNVKENFCDCGLYKVVQNKIDFNWGPYPELENLKNYYSANVKENFCDCGLYKVEQNKIDSNYVPLQRSVVFSATKEGYDLPCCRPTPYNNLDKTWGGQKPYTL